MADKNSGETPWQRQISIDLLLKVANITFLHPFVAWMIPLCMRAQAMPWSHAAIQLSIAYASLLSLLALLLRANKALAYGPPRPVDLAEEIIVITGGASGLGLLLAEAYGMRGATVIVLDVREMEAEGDVRGVDYFRCDVGDAEQLARVAATILHNYGPPTILINNAAIVHGKSLLSLSTEEIQRNFQVNLLSHFYALKLFLPGMLREQRGTVVTVSSVIGRLGCRNLSDYSAAKAGLIAMHNSLVAELPPSASIKTLLVTPGQFSTPLFAGLQTPSTFFAPILEPVEIAKEIIAAIDSGVSGVLSLPLYTRWVDLLPVMPVGIQRGLRWASGMNKAMDTFVGRKDDPQKKPKEHN
ncbi:MAG: hypothetical protein M1829_004468 [Trizodia sp. TS-e1964]|nr:MAG: hypothetical protein M1829_004468 [Trizodia sp. TS-e1964]